MNNVYYILRHLPVLVFLFLCTPSQNVDVHHSCTPITSYTNLNILKPAGYNIHLLDYRNAFSKAKIKTKLRVKYRVEQCYYDIVLTPETPHLFFAIGRVYTAALASPVFTIAKYSFTLRGPPTSAV